MALDSIRVTDRPQTEVPNMSDTELSDVEEITTDKLNAALGVVRNLRRRHPQMKLDLCHAKLHGFDLSDLDLTIADLRGADLSHAKLRNAKLTGVDLGLADLLEAQLHGADLT